MGFIHRSKSKFKNLIGGESGITLVELLIAIVFMSIVLMVATAMIIQSYDIFYGGTERMTASQMAEMAVNQLANDIRASEDVTVEVVNGDNNHCINVEHEDEYIRITIDEDENETLTYKYKYSDAMRGTIVREDRLVAFNVEKLCVEKIDIDNENNNEVEDEKPRFKISLTYVDRNENEKDRSTTVRRRN